MIQLFAKLRKNFISRVHGHLNFAICYVCYPGDGSHCSQLYFTGCEERGPFADDAYLSSPDPPVQAAAWARLNTSDPGANKRAWCVRPDDVGNATYVQIDLGTSSGIIIVCSYSKGIKELCHEI